MKCSLGIFNFLDEISSLSNSIFSLCFFALITEEGFLLSPCYSLELCIKMGISFLDLNQIPYDYTVEVRNRFKGLDMIECLLNYGWDSIHCIGERDQDHLQEKEMQKNKLAVSGVLTKSCEKKRSEKQRRKGKIYPFECRVPKNSQKR